MAEQAVAVGRQRLLAPEHDELRQRERRIVVAAGQSAGVVHLGVGRAQHVGGAGHARNVARVARLRVACVRRAERRMSVCRQHGAALAASAAHEQDGLGAIGLLVVSNLLRNQVECLVPRDALPFVLAAVLAGALHRVAHAVGVVHVVGDRQAPYAQASVRDRMVLVAFHLHQLARIVHVGFDAAAGRMAARWRPGTAAYDGEAVLLVAPRLAEVGRSLAFENLHALSSSRLCMSAVGRRSGLRAGRGAKRPRAPSGRGSPGRAAAGHAVKASMMLLSLSRAPTGATPRSAQRAPARSGSRQRCLHGPCDGEHGTDCNLGRKHPAGNRTRIAKNADTAGNPSYSTSE